MKKLAALLGLAGLGLASWLFVREGLGDVFAAFAVGGWGIVGAALVHFVSMALNARAWQCLLPRGTNPGLVRFTWFVWVREAVNGMLPVARVGGEFASFHLMRRAGVRTAPAVASLVVDMTITIGTQFLFTMLGLALLLIHHGDPAMVRSVEWASAAAVPVLALVLWVQRIGLFSLGARLLRTVAGERWSALAGGSERLDRAIRVSYRRGTRVLRCAGWQFAGWVAGGLEIYVALRVLGHPVDLSDAILVEAAVQAISSAAFLVPGALGVQEGAFLLLGGLIGLPEPVAAALALCRRARDVLVFGPALIAWQLAALRGALRCAPLKSANKI